MAGDFERRSCFMLLGGDGELDIRKGFGVRKPIFEEGDILRGDDEGDGKRAFRFIPIGDVDEEEELEGGGGGGGVKNKGSVAKLLKFKLSVVLGGNSVAAPVAGVAGIELAVIVNWPFMPAAALATIVGSDIVDLVPVVFVVEVLPHIEDNTKAAATVCS